MPNNVSVSGQIKDVLIDKIEHLFYCSNIVVNSSFWI